MQLALRLERLLKDEILETYLNPPLRSLARHRGSHSIPPGRP
jgi:hypothetical protein